MSEVMTKLEEKHKELITLKLKNEQLREKELYARLHLQDASTNKRQEQLRQELLRQSEANKDLTIQLANVKQRLEAYELSFDGLTRD